MSALKNASHASNVAPGRAQAVVVEVPMVLPSVANLREHWAVRAKRVKSQRRLFAWLLKADNVAHRVEKMALFPWRVEVTLTRIAPRALDSDNLVSAFKACRDQVATCLGVNDNDPRVTWAYAQAKGPAAVRLSFEVAP